MPEKGQGPAAETRLGWTALGDIGGRLFGGAKGNLGGPVPKGNVPPVNPVQVPVKGKVQEGVRVPRQPRTEFIIHFVWQEPTMEDRPATAAGKK